MTERNNEENIILREYSESFSCPFCGVKHTVTYPEITIQSFLGYFNNNDNGFIKSFSQYFICSCGKSILAESTKRLKKLWDFAGKLGKVIELGEEKCPSV